MNGEGVLLDTNVLIGLLKQQPASLQLLETVGDDEPLAYSAVTRMELLGFPELTPSETEAIESMLAELRYQGLTTEIEDRAIALRRHHRIKLPDAIIAATALVANFRLLTLDEELARVFGLEVAE